MVWALIVYYLFVGCVVIWIVVVVFWDVLVVSVGSLFLARVSLFGSFVFGVRVFTFFCIRWWFAFAFYSVFRVWVGVGDLLLVDRFSYWVVNLRWV